MSLSFLPFWVRLYFAPALAALVALIVLAVLARGVLFVVRRSPRRFFRPFFRFLAYLTPILVLGVAPVTIGYFVTRQAHTRGDESHYSGPVIDEQGEWHPTPRRKRGDPVPPPATTPNRFRVDLLASDGTSLRAFFVPPRSEPKAAAILVHGLFRGGLEIEPPASMLRDLGVAVLLLEMRNHGESGTKVCTFGRDEALDVRAGVDFLRSRPEISGRPLIAFGVSLGAAAVSLAAPRISPPPAAIVLDSPMASLAAAADFQLSSRVGVPEPFRTLLEWGIQGIGGVRFSQVVPSTALSELDERVLSLVIRCERDDTMPPDAADQVFAALPSAGRTMWVAAEAGHGKAWEVHPDEYRSRLAALLESVLAPPH